MNRRILGIFLAFTIAIIISAIYMMVPLNTKSNNIKKEMQGVRINKDTGEVLESLTVTIDGNINIWENSLSFSFDGNLSLSNLNHSKETNASLIYSNGFGKGGLEQRGNLSYQRNISKQGKIIPDIAMAFWVNTDSDFSYLVIANYEEDCINSSSDDSVKVFNSDDILIFPATDAVSALKILGENNVNKDIYMKTLFEDYNFEINEPD